MSTSEKAGSGAAYTYGQNGGRFIQYKWSDTFPEKVKQFYTLDQSLDAPVLDIPMSLMPQTNGYSKGGRFFVKIAYNIDVLDYCIYPNPIAYKSNLSDIINYQASKSLLEYTLANKGNKIVLPWVSYSSASFDMSSYGYPYSFQYGSANLLGQIAILRDGQQISQSVYIQYPVMDEAETPSGYDISPSSKTPIIFDLFEGTVLE